MLSTREKHLNLISGLVNKEMFKIVGKAKCGFFNSFEIIENKERIEFMLEHIKSVGGRYINFKRYFNKNDLLSYFMSNNLKLNNKEFLDMASSKEDVMVSEYFNFILGKKGNKIYLSKKGESFYKTEKLVITKRNFEVLEDGLKSLIIDSLGFEKFSKFMAKKGAKKTF